MKNNQSLFSLIIFFVLCCFLLNANAGGMCPFCGSPVEEITTEIAANCPHCYSTELARETEIIPDDQLDFDPLSACPGTGATNGSVADGHDNNPEPDDPGMLSQMMSTLYVTEDNTPLTVGSIEFDQHSDGTWATVQINGDAGKEPVYVTLNTTTQAALSGMGIKPNIAGDQTNGIDDIVDFPVDTDNNSMVVVCNPPPALTGEETAHTQMLVSCGNGGDVAVVQREVAQLRGVDTNTTSGNIGGDGASNRKATPSHSKKSTLPKRAQFLNNRTTYPVAPNLLRIPDGKVAFLVKIRTEISPGRYMAKLELQHPEYVYPQANNHNAPQAIPQAKPQAAGNIPEQLGESDLIEDGLLKKAAFVPRFPQRPGLVVFSREPERSVGNERKIPEPKNMKTRLGKGGNGYVYEVFDNNNTYAMKQTVFRTSEVNCQIELFHPNILCLRWLQIGDKHPRHAGKFYCFHFMERMGKSLRDYMTDEKIGSLYHLKQNLLEESQQNTQQPLALFNQKWPIVISNFKYIIRCVLKALEHMHAQGFAHRDVKASNIMLGRNHWCRVFGCTHQQKYQVKLGDFDSTAKIPGYNLKVESDQMIRYASVLPLGTPGYRAPEVSCHHVLAGPYEVLYNEKVDVWSLGCLMLNLLTCNGGPLKQRGWACLLLSAGGAYGEELSDELYHKGINIKKLEACHGKDNPQLVDMVKKCLQVNPNARASVQDLLGLDCMNNF